MRKIVLLAIVAVLFCAVAVAQKDAKVEIFGGYSYFRTLNLIDIAPANNINLNGWNASVTGYVSKNFGITGDFSGAYGSPWGYGIHAHTYMFGPTFRVPGERVTGFAHALFGGASLNLSGSSTDNGFAMAAGGGMDVSVNKRVAIRPVQFDYLLYRLWGRNLHNIRYSAGVVFKF